MCGVLYACACASVCLCVRMFFVSLCGSMSVCLYAYVGMIDCMCVFVYLCVFVSLYASMLVRLHVDVCMCACLYACVHVCLYVCMVLFVFFFVCL